MNRAKIEEEKLKKIQILPAAPSYMSYATQQQDISDQTGKKDQNDSCVDQKCHCKSKYRH